MVRTELVPHRSAKDYIQHKVQREGRYRNFAAGIGSRNVERLGRDVYV